MIKRRRAAAKAKSAGWDSEMTTGTISGLVSVTITLTVLLLIRPVSGAEITLPESKNKCEVAIIGKIEDGDQDKFRLAVVKLLQSGCVIAPRINIYSPGGAMEPAMEIANDIQFLHAITVAPSFYGGKSEKKSPEEAQRSCPFLPGETERRAREYKVHDKHMKAFQQALRDNKPLPKNPARLETYDPGTGTGNPDCTCASACFFIWIAGVERRGDIVLIHRPYFDPGKYKALGMSDARAAFSEMTKKSRQFLNSLDTPSSIVDAVFLTPSDKAVFLSGAQVESLRFAAYYAELKTAQCGPEPGEEPTLPSDATEVFKGDSNSPFKYLSPADRRELLKRAEREICWQNSQKEVRRALTAEFIEKYGRGPE